MSDATAFDGDNIDAVAASILDVPQKEDEKTEIEMVQADDADAESHDDEETLEATEEEAESAQDESDDEGEADAEEAEPAEQLYTVKVNGREQQVPLSELLRGYSGQAYIQEGMREVANAKKEAEQLFTTLQSERQQLLQFAQAVQTGQVPMQPPKAPDENLLKSDPIGYLEARVKYDKDLAAFQQTQAAMQELTARQAQAEQQSRAAYLAEQQQQLAQMVPAFAKPETAQKAKQDLISAGEAYGFSAEELTGITDARQIKVLWEAAQYRRLMAGKVAAEKPTAPRAPQTPTLKPGAKQPQQGKAKMAEKAKAQMKRTGAVDDVARFLLM